MSAIDKLKNKVQELFGEGKQQLGKITGDKQLEAEGLKDQAAGNLKQAGENLKGAFK